MGQRAIAVLVVVLLTCLVQQGAALQRLLLQQQAQQLAAWQQCGGTGKCRFGAACGDRTWPNTHCPQGYSCQRYDASFWQCKTGTGAASQSSNKQRPQQQKQNQQQQQQPQPTAKALDQCGGSNCKQGNCADKRWAACPGGYTCVRSNQWYWQCRPQATGWKSNVKTGIKQEQGNKPQQVNKAKSVPAKKSAPNDPDAPVIQEVDESVINRMTAVPSPSPPPAPPPAPAPAPPQQPAPQQQQLFFLPFFG